MVRSVAVGRRGGVVGEGKYRPGAKDDEAGEREKEDGAGGIKVGKNTVDRRTGGGARE